MNLRTLLYIATISTVPGVLCMEQPNDIGHKCAELDKYRQGIAVKKENLAENYREVLNAVKNEIIRLKKELKKATRSTEEKEEIIEGDDSIDIEGIDASLTLYESRLYDLSSDGELGSKIKDDKDLDSIASDIENFTELNEEIENQL